MRLRAFYPGASSAPGFRPPPKRTSEEKPSPKAVPYASNSPGAVRGRGVARRCDSRSAGPGRDKAQSCGSPSAVPGPNVARCYGSLSAVPGQDVAPSCVDSKQRNTAAWTLRWGSVRRPSVMHITKSPSSLLRQRDSKPSEELPNAPKPMRVCETPQDEQLSRMLWTRSRRHWR